MIETWMRNSCQFLKQNLVRSAMILITLDGNIAMDDKNLGEKSLWSCNMGNLQCSFFIVFDKEWKIVLGLHSVLATLHRRFTIRADLDLESGLKNGLECKKSTPLIGREARTRLFKFTP